MIDDSGVRVYYSNEPREIELGIMILGDGSLSLLGSPVREGPGLVEHSFECPSGCSATLLADQNITVFREHLHMHQSGASMRNEQIRDGEVVRTGRVDFYAFEQQGNPPVQQEPFQVLPGDSFKTVCNYDARGGEVFGLSSQEEMCM